MSRRLFYFCCLLLSVCTSVYASEPCRAEHLEQAPLSSEIRGPAEGIEPIIAELTSQSLLQQAVNVDSLARSISRQSSGEAIQVLYFLDTDNNPILSSDLLNGNVSLDVGHLSEGLHLLHVQAMNGDGAISRLISAFFYRGNTQAIGNVNCVCWIDGEQFRREAVPTSGGSLNWILDVSQLPAGCITVA